jgi:hypothetical protein
MISTFTVVFDANVFFSIRLTSLLLELVMSGLFRARWSADIHREWMTAVSENRGIAIEQLAGRRQRGICIAEFDFRYSIGSSSA